MVSVSEFSLFKPLHLLIRAYTRFRYFWFVHWPFCRVWSFLFTPVSQKNWVRCAAHFPKTLTLFMSKICLLSYPIYNLTKNSIAWLWLLWLIQLAYMQVIKGFCILCVSIYCLIVAHLVIFSKNLYSKEFSHGILSYFDHQQNFLQIEGNLKITVDKDRKTPKR